MARFPRLGSLFSVVALSAGLLAAPLPAQEKEAAKKDEKAEAGKKSAIFAEIVLKGSYSEGPQLPGLFGSISETLRDALARLDKAAGDDRIAGVVLKFEDPTTLSLDWSKVNEFRQAINRVREKGKPVYAWMTMPDTPSYLLASACDKVYMPESGTLLVLGLRAEVTFYKNLFDKLDVKPEMLRVGAFKSAAEPYTRTEMSPEFRQEMSELLDDLYGQLVAGIAEGRRLDKTKVAEAIDRGPLTADDAKAAGLIDGFAYEDELKARIAEDRKLGEAKLARNYAKKKVDDDFSGLQGFIKLMDLLAGNEPSEAKTVGPKIAVVYAVGAIMSGESQNGLLSGEVLGSETLVKAIDKARDDDDVKAIVLRVDSPGGSALASDLIWRSVKLAKEKKPVLVSMGYVAGSGGYYISMAADKIVAEPGTITGSIGVVGGKVAFGGLLKKVGVTTSVIKRGENSGALSVMEGFTDAERAAMQRMLDDIYRQFTAKAAEGRGMPVEELEKLARGRIYSGTRAKDLKLVDEIGTLSDTIELAKAAARERGTLGKDDKADVISLPKPKSPLEELLGPIGGETRAAGASALIDAAGTISPELAEALSGLGVVDLLAKERVLTLVPYRLSVK